MMQIELSAQPTDHPLIQARDAEPEVSDTCNEPSISSDSTENQGSYSGKTTGGSKSGGTSGDAQGDAHGGGGGGFA